jgi:transcriptional regulator with XRE-family HTH domain
MKMQKQHGNKSNLAALRKRIGLNQEQLAELLNLHRSTINMAELGERTLPTAALLMLANLEIMLSKTVDHTYMDMHPAEQPGMEIFGRHHDQLFERESICTFNRRKMEKKLTMKIALYQSTRDRLHFIETAMQQNSNDGQTVQFWKGLQETAIQVLNTCGLALQALLRCRIAILDAEAELYKNMKLHQKKNLPGFFFQQDTSQAEKNTDLILSPSKTNTMNYTVSLLTNKPDCQVLINIANAEKEALSYRKTGLERQRSSATLTSAEIEAELTSVNAELDALQTVINSLPEGPTKTEAVRKFKKAEYKKFLLEQRKGNYGVVSLLEKEYDIACIVHDIEEADAFIVAVTDRMNEL